MKKKQLLQNFIVILFWLAIWQVAGLVVHRSILLPLPLEVIRVWLGLIVTAGFWKAIAFSLVRILAGFCLALLLGVVFSTLSYLIPFVKTLITPFMSTIRAVPVASFIILALVWIPSRNLSVFISFMITLPVIYENVLKGLMSTEEELRQMAEIYQISLSDRIRHVYLPAVLPYFESALSIAVGLCWKSGVAAEVIGIPKGSIGENLYNAKVYLETPELFAWTLTIILISVIFEKVIKRLLLPKVFSFRR